MTKSSSSNPEPSPTSDVELNHSYELSKLYETNPSLKVVETKGNHRLKVRQSVLKLAPKFAVGAELGVFTGLFSEVLTEITKPKTLYLVDPWSKLHGDFYPNWGAYTANQRLPTHAAKQATELRALHLASDAFVIEALATDWLSEFNKPFLDWVYLDASHKHEAVLTDLYNIAPKMRPGGVIMGDDCWLDSQDQAEGVATALNNFLEDSEYDIIYHDKHGQWALQMSESALKT